MNNNIQFVQYKINKPNQNQTGKEQPQLNSIKNDNFSSIQTNKKPAIVPITTTTNESAGTTSGWKFAQTPSRVRAASNLPTPNHYQSPTFHLSQSVSSPSSPNRSTPSSPSLPKKVINNNAINTHNHQQPLPPIPPMKSFKINQHLKQQSSSLPSSSVLSLMASKSITQFPQQSNHINNNNCTTTTTTFKTTNIEMNNDCSNNNILISNVNSSTSPQNNRTMPLCNNSPSNTIQINNNNNKYILSNNINSNISNNKNNSSNNNNNNFTVTSSNNSTTISSVPLISSPPSTNSPHSPTNIRKQTLIGKFKGIVNNNIINNNINNDYIVSSKNNIYNNTSNINSSDIENNSINNNNNYLNNFTMAKEKKITSEDIIQIFNLPKNEIILSEHPCAYRKKVSKAGKIYITNTYFCFYSLIFNSEIKEYKSFKEIKNIKKVTSIILGSSIEITTNQNFKYVFGLFESTENAYWALIKQLTYHQNLVDVKPVAVLTKSKSTFNIFGSSKDEHSAKHKSITPAMVNEPQKSTEGRVRFTSMSAVQKDNHIASESSLNRTRSGSLPNYSTIKRKKIKESLTQLVSFNKKRSNSNDSEESNNSDNRSTTTTTTTTCTSSNETSIIGNPSIQLSTIDEIATSSTSPKNSVGTNILELAVKSNVGSPAGVEIEVSKPSSPPPKLKNRSLTFGYELNKNFRLDPDRVTKDKEREKEKDDSKLSSPPREAQRERSNSIFNLMKGRKKMTKNKESEEKLNQMLISRRSKYDAAQLYLHEDVIGVPMEQLRIDDNGCPLFVSLLFIHLESMVEDHQHHTIMSIYFSNLSNCHHHIATTRLSNHSNSNEVSLNEMQEISEEQMEFEIEMIANNESGHNNLFNRNHQLEKLILSTKRGKEDAYKEIGSSPKIIGELLKHFLKSLPQPLMPGQLLKCLEVDSEIYKISMIRSIIYSQPQAAWTMFRMLIIHFVKLVDQHSSMYRSSILTPDLDCFGSNNPSEFLYPSREEIFEYIAMEFGPLILGTNIDLDGIKSSQHSDRDKSVEIILFILNNHLEFISENIHGIQYYVKKGKQIVKSAPIEHLIVKLTDIYYRDETLLDTFNLTHEDYYFPSNKYLEHLFDLYNASTQPSNVELQWRQSIRERVLYLIRKLMETKSKVYWQSNSGSELLLSIRSLLRENLSRLTSYEENQQLLQLDEYCKQQTDFSTVQLNNQPPNNRVLTTTNNSNNNSPILSSSNGSNSPSILKKSKNDFILAATRTMPTRKFTVVDSDSAEVAIQIALINEQTFRALHVSELLLNRFAKPEQSPCFQAMVASFNRWSAWVGSEVLGAATVSARASLFERFIEIASNLLELNDFHASYAITMGLQHYAIRRLTLSWERVSKKSMAIFQQTLQKVFATDANHKAYRERLHSAKSPLIPYIGIYSKDLFSVGDASPTLLENQVLNLDKMRQIHSIVHLLQSYRQVPYPMKPVPALQTKILERQILNDDEMYEKSLLLEPRQSPQ